jgi:hypothetical protein
VDIVHANFPPPLSKNTHYIYNYTAITDNVITSGPIIVDYNHSLVEPLNLSYIFIYNDGPEIVYTIYADNKTVYVYKNGVLIYTHNLTAKPVLVYDYSTDPNDYRYGTAIDVSIFPTPYEPYFNSDMNAWVPSSTPYSDGVHIVDFWTKPTLEPSPAIWESPPADIDVAPFPDKILVIYYSGYLYADPSILVPASPPPVLYELKGYTSRLLLRNPADLKVNAVFTLRAKFYTNLDLRNVTYLNATGLQPTACTIEGTPLVISTDQIFITLENDSITTPLVLVYNNTVFFINNFVLVDGNRYVFRDYRAYKIDNTPICYIQFVNNTNKTICTSFRLVKLDPPPSPPFFVFHSLYASYEYSVSKGWVLVLVFSTEDGTFTFYTPLSDILFYGVRVVNITSIDDYDVLAMDHQVLNAIISTASFYYWVLTDNPDLFIFSRERGVKLEVPANTTQYTFTLNRLSYIGCTELMQYLNISNPSLIPSCWDVSYASVENPVNATIGDNLTVNIETHEIRIKKYQPPDFYNVPAWMGFIADIFKDMASFIATSVQALGSTFIATLLNKDMWMLFFVFIVFAHVVIILHNPADLYPLYKELYAFTLTIFKTVYDVMVWIANAVASIIEAINPL